MCEQRCCERVLYLCERALTLECPIFGSGSGTRRSIDAGQIVVISRTVVSVGDKTK